MWICSVSESNNRWANARSLLSIILFWIQFFDIFVRSYRLAGQLSDEHLKEMGICVSSGYHKEIVEEYNTANTNLLRYALLLQPNAR